MHCFMACPRKEKKMFAVLNTIISSLIIQVLSWAERNETTSNDEGCIAMTKSILFFIYAFKFSLVLLLLIYV